MMETTRCEWCQAVARRHAPSGACSCSATLATQTRIDFNLAAKPYCEDGRWWLDWMPAVGELRPSVYQIWSIARRRWEDGLFPGLVFTSTNMNRPDGRYRKPWIIDPTF